MTFNNIGIICKKQKKFQLALEFYRKSLKIRKEASNKRGMAGSMTNIGMLFTALYDHVNANQSTATNTTLLDSALSYQEMALVIGTELSDDYTMTHTFLGIAEIYFKKLEYSKAEYYYQEA